MKMINLYITVSLLTISFVYGQSIPNNSLPFENNDITVGKVMAGMIALTIYFIPTIISKDKISWKYIFIFNLLTAWTVIGWFVTFIWSLNAKGKTFESSQIKKNQNLNLNLAAKHV